MYAPYAEVNYTRVINTLHLFIHKLFPQNLAVLPERLGETDSVYQCHIQVIFMF